MRLVIALGSHHTRYLTPAIDVVEYINSHLPKIEIFVHLLDDEKGRGNTTAAARQRLAEHLADISIYVTPHPLSHVAASSTQSTAALEANTVNQNIKNRLVVRVSDFALEPLNPDAVLCFAPQNEHTLGVFTDGEHPLTRFTNLTLDPDSQHAEAMQSMVVEWLEKIRTTLVNIPKAMENHKPRLAFVSPLPPLQTGIADYSCELLEALVPYYTITLIVEQETVEPASLVQRFAIHDSRWFKQYGSSFDRVLYHWGNSQHHTHMLALLDQHPGCVVLHDFFSGDAIKYIADQQQDFGHVLYMAHGYGAVAEWHQDLSHAGIVKTLQHFPLNHPVISRATGVLVHSQYALGLARQWYPEHVLNDWRQVPFLRLMSDNGSVKDNRSSQETRQHTARDQLGLDKEAFVICTFGLITPNKCTQELFEAFTQSELANKSHVQLIIVGGYGHCRYQQTLEKWLKKYNKPATIQVTGYASADTYRHYLQAADIGVQLRANSRGETSAAVFDCLAAGLPMIANAHGSVAELPEHVAYLIPDKCNEMALRQALETLYQDALRRKDLAQAGQCYVRELHSSDAVGHAYAAAIEELTQKSRLGRYHSFLDDLMTLRKQEGLVLDNATDLAALSEAVDISLPPVDGPRLLVDVSNIANHDLRTGIERVTRNLCEIFLYTPPEGYRVELIRCLSGELYYARTYAAERLGLAPILGENEPLTPRQGDIYLSLEWSPPVLAATHQRFQAMRAQGVKLYFTVFDALPMQFPHHFPDFVEGTYEDWLSRVLTLADGLCCISAAVADDIRTCAYQLPEPLRPEGELPPLWHFHLGADFTARAASQGLRTEDNATLEKLTGDVPILLMVGTLEPRKGHAQVISAMEYLWHQGSPAQLVIVGKLGWKMDAIAKRLDGHPEKGKRLFWIKGASDDMLAELYRISSALVAASEGEGFGLPLIEAAQQGISIIARDIPVFREVAGQHASYFNATDGEGLALELQAWLKAYSAGKTPKVEHMPWLSWEQSAQQLLSQVLTSNTH